MSNNVNCGSLTLVEMASKMKFRFSKCSDEFVYGSISLKYGYLDVLDLVWFESDIN